MHSEARLRAYRQDCDEARVSRCQRYSQGDGGGAVQRPLARQRSQGVSASGLGLADPPFSLAGCRTRWGGAGAGPVTLSPRASLINFASVHAERGGAAQPAYRGSRQASGPFPRRRPRGRRSGTSVGREAPPAPPRYFSIVADVVVVSLQQVATSCSCSRPSRPSSSSRTYVVRHAEGRRALPLACRSAASPGVACSGGVSLRLPGHSGIALFT